MEEIKIKLEGGILPKKVTPFAAAYDLFCPVDYELKHGRQIIDLKFRMELPHGKAAIIQSRSGFASKGFLVLSKVRRWWFVLFGMTDREKRIDADCVVGLIDEDYRDHPGVIVKCHQRSFFHKYIVPKGSRIAQMRIVDVPDTEISLVDDVNMNKNRGGGFGHTGVK